MSRLATSTSMDIRAGASIFFAIWIRIIEESSDAILRTTSLVLILEDLDSFPVFVTQ